MALIESVAPGDAFIVRWFRKAGAVIVARGLTSRSGVVPLAFADPAESNTAVMSQFAEAVDDLRRLGPEVRRGFAILETREFLSQGVFCRRFRYDMYRQRTALGDDEPIRDGTGRRT